MQVLKRTLFILASILTYPALGTVTAPQPEWQNWSGEVFERARQENRYVLLDLEAVWCHWCHVMDQTTYTDEAVRRVLRQHYIAVKVDHDARPDLANRYREYGWPATIIFAPDGTEIVKRAGYIPAEPMTRLLNAIVVDPSPENAELRTSLTPTATSALSEALRRALVERHKSAYDSLYGGLKLNQKFLDRDSVEYSMVRAADGDEREADRARHTLDAASALIDPVWGGVYQYSTGGTWQHPHYEKIMRSQASYLRIYALAFEQYRDPRYLKATLDIYRYLNAFLKDPQGVFYVSQDADLAKGQKAHDYFKLDDKRRRTLGVPRIDTHLYAQENGWMVEALATLYKVTNDKRYLNEAAQVAHWVKGNRSFADGGFSHDADDPAGPYLGDTLAMGRGFLQLYRVTGNRKWLADARAAAEFIEKKFKHKAGYNTAVQDDSPIPPVPQLDENIQLARFANLLHHYTGDARYRTSAEHAMAYLASGTVALSRLTDPGILLADEELARPPLHITVVGGKVDAAAQKLFEGVLSLPGWYQRVEWWDHAEGSLPNPDVRYPQLHRAAAFVCTDNRCSLPAFSTAALIAILGASPT